MEKKCGIILREEDKATFEDATPEECKHIILALYQYAETKTLPDSISRIEKIALNSLMHKVDYDQAKYEERSKVRSDAGKKGAQARWEIRRSDSTKEEKEG